ncbi:unnamed protein product [Notodromas monacha]|uniref:Uncharacterized protein n=1 Tax=Notodromas monacha TaxID=399045 RepID=A0A7R9GJX9_9CRUS|nr:unnamed protein product [Notodromas monacha]CAG0924039.1 unnamed protein product [Notodromas monacha]
MDETNRRLPSNSEQTKGLPLERIPQNPVFCSILSRLDTPLGQPARIIEPLQSSGFKKYLVPTSEGMNASRGISLGSLEDPSSSKTSVSLLPWSRSGRSRDPHNSSLGLPLMTSIDFGKMTREPDPASWGTTIVVPGSHVNEGKVVFIGRRNKSRHADGMHMTVSLPPVAHTNVRTPRNTDATTHGRFDDSNGIAPKIYEDGENLYYAKPLKII